MSDAGVGYGQIDPDDTSTDLQVAVAICRAIVAQLDFMKLVKVVAVHPGSGTPPIAGTVDVLPLVNQIDGGGFAVPHGNVFGIPYFRLAGGPWQIVCDPAAGDYGYVVCADRDSSNVVKNPGQQVPGSRRKNNVADGVYVGGVINGAPKAWLWLKPDGTWQLSDEPGNVLQGDSNGIAATPVSGMPFTINGIAKVAGNLLLEGDILSESGGTYAGNIATGGTVTANVGGSGGSVGLTTHSHKQPNDSHGDVEAATDAPTGGT